MKKTTKAGTVLAMTLLITNIAFASDVVQSIDVVQSFADVVQSIVDVVQSVF